MAQILIEKNILTLRLNKSIKKQNGIKMYLEYYSQLNSQYYFRDLNARKRIIYNNT